MRTDHARIYQSAGLRALRRRHRPARRWWRRTGLCRCGQRLIGPDCPLLIRGLHQFGAQR